MQITFSKISIPSSQSRLYVWEGAGRWPWSIIDTWTEGVLLLTCCVIGVGTCGLTSFDTLFRLWVLSLRFDWVAISVPSELGLRVLLEQSSYVRSEEILAEWWGRICICIAFMVFLTNCPRDILELRSATWRSVLSRSREYATAWTISSDKGSALNQQ